MKLIYRDKIIFQRHENDDLIVFLRTYNIKADINLEIKLVNSLTKEEKIIKYSSRNFRSWDKPNGYLVEFIYLLHTEHCVDRAVQRICEILFLDLFLLTEYGKEYLPQNYKLLMELNKD